MTSSSSKDTQLSRRIDSIYQSYFQGEREFKPEDAPAISREELYAMADVCLGEDYDRQKIEAVASLQQAAQAKQLAFAREVQAGGLTLDQYGTILGQLMSDTAEQCARILGLDDFVKLFGVAVEDVPDLIRR